jgi:ribosomal protein S18 acetylase RimI-like enzyme
MIVRLHNLSARHPSFGDAAEIADLLRFCEPDEAERAEITEEAIRQAWQGMHLPTDAWVIATRQGRLVGYADVRDGRAGQYMLTLYVHPEYRGRGIGTLLIRLAEERAREMLLTQEAELRVTLNITLSARGQSACRLLEREGYTLTRSFWRLLIDPPDVSAQTAKHLSHSGKLRLNMVLDAHHNVNVQDGLYVAQQYVVYSKLLREGAPENTPQPVELASVRT